MANPHVVLLRRPGLVDAHRGRSQEGSGYPGMTLRPVVRTLGHGAPSSRECLIAPQGLIGFNQAPERHSACLLLARQDASEAPQQGWRLWAETTAKLESISLDSKEDVYRFSEVERVVLGMLPETSVRPW